MNIHSNLYLHEVINELRRVNSTYLVLINPKLDYPVPFDTYTNPDLKFWLRFLPTFDIPVHFIRNE